MTAFASTLGIDVSKRTLDGAFWPEGGTIKAGNNEAGFTALRQALADRRVDAVAVEATGGYERGLVHALREAGVRVLVLPPRDVRAFAQLRHRMAKTDRLDARVIAEFAALFGEDRPIRPEALERVAAHLTYYEQLSAAAAQIKTQLEMHIDPEIRELCTKRIAQLMTDKRAVLARLRALVAEDDDLATRVRQLQSMPGIGFLNAVSLAVRLPELGRLSRHTIASLVGVAPFAHDSGQYRGKRCCQGGRERVRTLLYMGALAASRCNPTIQAFCQRLKNAGKPHKLVIVAAMRKLIVILNAMVRDGKSWQTAAA